MSSLIKVRIDARLQYTEYRSLVGGSGVILHQKIFKSGNIETLFSVLVMSYVSEKSASNMKMANHYDQNN